MCVRQFLSLCLIFFTLLTTAIADATSVKYVYVINAASGTLTRNKDADGKGFTFTMHAVEGNVDWLKSRPYRSAGVIPIATFVRAWGYGKGSFAEVPPNALLISKSFIPLGSFGGAVVHSFVLANPRYDTDEKTLVFDAEYLPGNNKPIKEGIYRNLSVVIAD